MQENFIYAESLSFEELLERMNELLERFREVQIDDDFFQSSEYNPQKR
jgi:hypothetical protein